MRPGFLLTLWCLVACAVVGRAGEPLQPAHDPYEVVKTAEQFIIGGVGIAGTTSGQEAAFRQLLKGPDPGARCRQLLSEGTLPGQLYGLLGLKLLDREAFQAALPRYRDSRTTVPTVRGCIVMHLTTAQIAQEIDEGQLQ